MTFFYHLIKSYRENNQSKAAGANCVVTIDLRRRGGPFGGHSHGAGDIRTHSKEHLQREGDSQFRGGPFGGRAMVQGDTGARSAILRAS